MNSYAKNFVMTLAALCLASMLGCSNTKVVPVIEYATFHKCPRPTKTFILIPYEDDYLDSPINAEIALKNRIIQDEYIQAWIDAVLCYEKQILNINSKEK